MRVRSSIKSVHWCGAVVVSPLHVITAAHCLQDYVKAAYFVRAGDHDTEASKNLNSNLGNILFLKSRKFFLSFLLVSEMTNNFN